MFEPLLVLDTEVVNVFFNNCVVLPSPVVSSCRLGSRRSSPSPPVGVLPAAVDAVAPVSSDGVPACQRSSQIIKIKGQKFESKLCNSRSSFL